MEEFDLQTLMDLKEYARRTQPPMRPIVTDDGREMYLLLGERLFLDYLPVGWTLRALTANNYEFVFYEPVPIESL